MKLIVWQRVTLEMLMLLGINWKNKSALQRIKQEI